MTTSTHSLATALKAWRGNITAGQAAALLGIPLRTLNGIEQGRPFRYARLLELAMRAIEAGHEPTANARTGGEGTRRQPDDAARDADVGRAALRQHRTPATA